MKTVGAAAALVLGGMSLGAGAAPERIVPVTLIGGDETAITMSGGHPSHLPLLVVASKAGTSRLVGHIQADDQELARRVNFRRSILVAALVDYELRRYCRKNLTLRRVRLTRGRLDATATVEDYSGCVSIPETTGMHLYSLATFPRRFAAKPPRAGRLTIRLVPAS